MSWTDSVLDLRNLISDGPTDKFSYRKQVVGDADGVNISFKTSESKRITNFSQTLTPPQGIYVNGALVTVTTDYPTEGEFVLALAPANGSRIEATYYSQWFDDTQIGRFLTSAVQWCMSISDITAVPDGLQPATLHYAASEAYKTLSLLFVRSLSSTYKFEDDKSDGVNPVAKTYANSAKTELALAEAIREQYFKRNDQYMAPYSRSLQGRVPSVQPKK